MLQVIVVMLAVRRVARSKMNYEIDNLRVLTRKFICNTMWCYHWRIDVSSVKCKRLNVISKKAQLLKRGQRSNKKQKTQ